ncbi:NAD(P)/FAD-dependent oxidoreductase [Litoreibacter arenae]|uniref:Sarcosine oxidase n=1 Tax=Litoreibacter arenae DSM 19593 TaxID=1123360 RepID=S9QNE6_9RHOB|nr:FAD-dependent oxidoreductase [Litoreibacter arenae]EPX81093.1 Sarcosine oxidase [Litoreibacter arenae DSM 19593]
MSIAVIGRGLWGAAAARHLAMAGQNVTLIGPPEPRDKRGHEGVFGSHYDEGRITRKNALDEYWVGVSTAAIDRYGEIERQSGIRFYTETGAVMAGGEEFMARVDVGRLKHNVPCDALDHQALAARFPFFRFPDHFTGYHESTRAGHVSPRNLVAAQTKAAHCFGAALLEETVTGLEERRDHVEVTTDQDRHRFDQVLVAAGYNTDTVLARAPKLDVYARTVAFFEVSEAEAARLSTMPTLVYDTPEDPYLLPPIRYPDGKLYIKLGGDPEDVPLVGQEDIGDWFRSGGNPQVRDHLHGMIRQLMPDLDIRAVSMEACVTSWTKDRLPEIGRLSDRVAVCTGGNGAGAKCSDETGRLGAALILEKTGETA